MLKSKIKFEKFKKAFASLKLIYLKPHQEDRSNIDATIQRFEFTFELAWKFLKDHFSEQGIELYYPKEIFQEAYAMKIINHEEVWVSMLRDRNLASHTYNEKLADAIYERMKIYVPELELFLNFFENGLQ